MSAHSVEDFEFGFDTPRSKLEMHWVKMRSPCRAFIEDLLARLGAGPGDKDFVVTVDLPPRPATPSLGPTNQPAP